MPLAQERRPAPRREAEGERRFLEEAVRDKEALAHVLTRRALEAGDGRLASFYYLAASFLRDGEVRPFGRLMATDGKNFYVGPAYLLAKQKYGERVVPFLWLHEVLHIVHAHPRRMRLVPDRRLYNIVADLYVNTLLERRLGRIPGDFVTLPSFVKFVVSERGRELTPEERRALEDLARLVAEEKVTVEEAYAVIEKIPAARSALEERFKGSLFFGSDMGGEEELAGGGGGQEAGQGKGAGAGGGAGKAGEAGAGGEKGGEGGGEEARGAGAGSTTSSDTGSGTGTSGEGGGAGGVEELERELRSLREHLDEVMEKARMAIGEFKALRGAVGGPPGTAEGVFARAEYEEIQRLRVELEEALLAEVGRVVREHEVDFSRFSREAYWLPEDRELFRSRIVVFLDTSGSIPPQP